MLASKLSPRMQLHVMPQIRIPGHGCTADPTKILEVFQVFYTNLYKAHPTQNTVAIDHFLDKLLIPVLDTEHKKLMEAPFSEEEVLGVIQGLRCGSAPGPDGLSNPYYKTFAPTVAPQLVKFFNAKTKGDPIDAQLNSAFIVVIPKLDKNPEEVSNYRPISLINCDLKILTKLLANRFSSLINNYIHKEKTRLVSYQADRAWTKLEGRSI